MRKLIARAIFLVAALAASGASAQSCLKADDTTEVTISGRLAVVKFAHPMNESPQQAYVILLPQPVCADVTDSDGKVQRVTGIGRVQLVGELDERLINGLMGKRVTVGGTLFGQHTAYHIAPILIAMKSIDEAK